MVLKDYFIRLINAFESIGSAHCILEVSDLLLINTEISINQFLVGTRMIDLDNYINAKEQGLFLLQNRISSYIYGAAHDEKVGNYHYESLIESYMEKGYDKKSEVICDRSFNIVNGTHRIACNAILGFETIAVKKLKRSISNRETIYQYYSGIFDITEIEGILEKYYQYIRKMKHHNFLCFFKKDVFEPDIEEYINKKVIVEKKEEIGDFVILYIWLSKPQFRIKKNKMISDIICELEISFATEWNSINRTDYYFAKSVTESFKYLASID